MQLCFIRKGVQILDVDATENNYNFATENNYNFAVEFISAWCETTFLPEKVERKFIKYIFYSENAIFIFNNEH